MNGTGTWAGSPDCAACQVDCLTKSERRLYRFLVRLPKGHTAADEVAATRLCLSRFCDLSASLYIKRTHCLRRAGEAMGGRGA